ncbi:L-aspartate oxidase [Pseudoruegeria sp. SHC-113]|uniref:L-aspartate oxidase n=1 Tax=Pseudoruegeria sp. SHC-113 TaxID=2855439 RepID=UPI0021BA582A|nr:L-aspartate oxidase [Pseudoruegeria sp. SHC-113]MCT8159324.1 L-aspartate oxidase [Pseudoruegeria sp. SHC-113]
MATHTDRIVIVGAGIGALYAALKLAPRPVLVISPDPLGQGASSAWAQGGVAAAMAAADSAESHATDTLGAGAGTVDPEVARFVTHAARDHILDLTTLGTPFDRDENGQYVLSLEAAHSYARVVRVKGDQAGREIMEALIAVTRETPSVQVLEGVLATGIETEVGRATGVWLQSADPATPTASALLTAPAILLAGGGSAGLYALTTNPPRIRGQVIGMAARAGAVISDAEFVQFHPTAIDIGEDPAPLATEALRGEGATLVNAAGERFMLAEHPKAELAPRDIVARAIFAQTQVGKRPMLDCREVFAKEGLARFPAVAEACARAGLDPLTTPIPVAAAAHYHMGGIDTDLSGKSSLPGLWACGEAASTGLHGANRLASNGLLEALVFARACALSIAEALPDGPQTAAPVALALPPASAPETEAAITTLRTSLTVHVGVVRTADGLRKALATLAELQSTAQDESLKNMLATATLITAAAWQRRESRGGHFRADFPEADPAQAQRSRLTLADAITLQAEALSR